MKSNTSTEINLLCDHKRLFKEVWIIWISPLDYPLIVCSGHSDSGVWNESESREKIGRKRKKEDALTSSYLTFYPSLFFVLTSYFTMLGTISCFSLHHPHNLNPWKRLVH